MATTKPRLTTSKISGMSASYATIIKVEDDQQLVFGWANIIKTAGGSTLLDRQDDFIDDEVELEKAAYEYVLHSRDGGEMHVRKGVSTLVESVVLTKEKQEALGIPAGSVPTGWWIGFKVNDDRVWEQVKKGDYIGFSVHGTGKREKRDITGLEFSDVGKGEIIKYIKQKPNGKWCVYSESGKLLSEHDTKGEAQKRLAQIEHFKKEQPTSSEVHVDSTEWDKRKRKRRILTDAMLEKFNPNHDELGRFSSGPGGGAPKGDSRRRRRGEGAKEYRERTGLIPQRHGKKEGSIGTKPPKPKGGGSSVWHDPKRNTERKPDGQPFWSKEPQQVDAAELRYGDVLVHGGKTISVRSVKKQRDGTIAIEGYPEFRHQKKRYEEGGPLEGQTPPSTTRESGRERVVVDAGTQVEALRISHQKKKKRKPLSGAKYAAQYDARQAKPPKRQPKGTGFEGPMRGYD